MHVFLNSPNFNYLFKQRKRPLPTVLKEMYLSYEKINYINRQALMTKLYCPKTNASAFFVILTVVG